MGLVALALSTGFQIASPLVLREAIDSLGETGDLTIAGYAGLFIGLAVLGALFRYLSRRLILSNARGVEHDLRGAYFSRLMDQKPERIEEGRKGDFVSRGTHDIQDVRLFLGAGILNFFLTLFLLLVTVVILLKMHAVLTLVALSPFPVVSWLVRKKAPLLHARFMETNRREGDMSAIAQESLTGFRLLRGFNVQRWQSGRFEAANEEVRAAQARTVRTWAVIFPVVGFVAGMGQILVLIFGGYLVSQNGLTMGEFVAFNAYITMLVWPMVALGWTLSLLQRGKAALGRLSEVMERAVFTPGSTELPGNHGLMVDASGLTFVHVNGGREVLKSVDLSIAPSGFYGLVGTTGSGKTTLIELLSGLRRPEAGGVSWLGVPVEEAEPAALHDLFAVVPQYGFFFAATVAENVLLGRERDDAKLRWALETAGLAAEVDEFPGGPDARVGEGGVTLSGGQKQRLSLARALYGEPRTLILDAALSNLDAETAGRVLGNLRTALPDVTLLVASHRGVELDTADEVFFLNGGVIEDRGTHRELLETSRAYYRLYREEQLRLELAR